MANTTAKYYMELHDLFWELSSIFYHSGKNPRTQSPPTAVPCPCSLPGAQAPAARRADLGNIE